MDDGLVDLGAGAGEGGGGKLKSHSKTQFVMATSKEAEEDNRGEKEDAAGGKNVFTSVVVSIHHVVYMTHLLLHQSLVHVQPYPLS